MTHDLDRDTAVHRSGAGTFAATVTDRWSVLDGPPNGGYVLAIAVQAMRRGTDHPHVATATGHFLRPAEPGPATVVTELVKKGRQLSTLRATLLQQDRPVLTALAAFGDLSAADGPTRLLQPRLQLPEPHACVAGDRAPEYGFTAPPIARRMGLALHPADIGFVNGSATSSGLMRGWVEQSDGRAVDDLAALVACDAFPPAAFNMGVPIAWAPTVELTVHVHNPGPFTGPVGCQFQSTTATNGLVTEEGRVEAQDGTPIAVSRQLLLAPRTS